MPKLLWVDLSNIEVNEAIWLILTFIGAWLLCHSLSLGMHTAILAVRKKFRMGLQPVSNDDPRVGNVAREFGLINIVEYKDESEILKAIYNEKLRLIFLYFLHPLVFTKKTRIAIAILVTWWIAKFVFKF